MLNVIYVSRVFAIVVKNADEEPFFVVCQLKLSNTKCPLWVKTGGIYWMYYLPVVFINRFWKWSIVGQPWTHGNSRSLLKTAHLVRLHVYGHIDGHLVNSNALKLFNIRLFDTSFLHYLSKKNIILWKM